jgi:biotin synthase
VLTDTDVPLLRLLDAAFTVRSRHFGREVQIHVLNNAQNGLCPEDCSYCSQAKTSTADIEPYTLKPEAEVLAEAERAHDAGAHRYCMVFSGRGPTDKRTEKLAGYVRSIKRSFPGLEVCVSAGLLDEPKARLLKAAGLDRLNHNLNTSRERYPSICTTHTYDDRLNTLRAAQAAGLQTCSGLIVGMGETVDELLELATTLRGLRAESIPVNFLLPFEGTAIGIEPNTGGVALTPDFCLRVLCLFRFASPASDVRCAAGREHHFASLEPLCLYPSNSIFLGGYLNSRGAERERTYRFIRDAGFELSADHSIDAKLEAATQAAAVATRDAMQPVTVNGKASVKTLAELRPARDVR